MTDVISIEKANAVAIRLKEARLATAMSTRAVAELISKRFPSASISHSSIANYEKPGSAVPIKAIELLAATYERPLAWFLESSQPLRGVRYRSLSSRVLVRERHQYETQAQHWLEGYVRLERKLKQRLVRKYKIEESYKNLPPEELANVVRTECGYRPDDAIRSVVDIMQWYGIRVIELQTPYRIDGLAAQFGTEFAVVLNPAEASDRCRLNAGHELDHVLQGDCTASGRLTRAMEDRAFEFASSLLIPTQKLREVFTDRSMVAIKEAKEYYGISMAAMIYRAAKLKFIDERATKWLWIQFAKRGWRADEPGVVRPDRATRFETLIEKAVREDGMTWREVAAIVGVSKPELDQRIRQAIQPPVKNQLDQEGGSSGPRLFTQSLG